MSGSRAGAAAPDGTSDWRGPVLAAAVWAGTWAGTAGRVDLAAAALALGLGLAGAGWWWRNRLLAAAAIALLVGAGVGAARAWSTMSGPVAEWAAQGAVVTIEARLGAGEVHEGARGGPLFVAGADLRRVTGRGAEWETGAAVRISASGGLAAGWAGVRAGSVVRVAVRLAPAGPGEPFAAWARARAAPQVLTPPGALDEAVTAVRAGLRAAVSGLPEGPRALVPALVVGDTGLMPAGLREDFRTTGLTHLTAVSGANLTYLLAVIVWVAARTGVTGWGRRVVAAVGVVAFVLLCRAEPSVLRAAAMGVLGLAALGWGRGRKGLGFLAWAVAGLLLADPWLCRSIGFLLSVCASAGIIGWASRWADLLGWLPRWLAEALTVPIAAQLATQPVVTAISGQVSLSGLLANLVAAPLVGPATVLGFVAAGLSVPLLPVAVAAGWLAGGFAQALCWIAGAGAALPGAAVPWPAGPVAVGVLAACCAAVVVGLPLLLTRPWLVAAVTAAMLLALLRPVPVPGWPPGRWAVVSCDVGQGDATVVWAADGSAVVVDAGPDERRVDQCLDQLGVAEVAWLVFTHLHADHAAGVAGVAAGRRVAGVLFSGVTEPTGGWHRVRAALPGVPVTIGAPGTVVAAGGARLEVLSVRPYRGPGPAGESVPGPEGEDSADQNDSSLVMRATSRGVRVLLAGDVEPAGQEHAVATGADLSADVLLVPHHGSARQTPAFLAAARASLALVSVGADNDYGHPAPRTIAAAGATGAPVYRTDTHGSIAVTRDGEQLRVTTQRGG